MQRGCLANENFIRGTDATTTLDPERTKNRMTGKRKYALKTPLNKVMTVEEVSHYLHIHPSTLYRLLKRGEIPAFRIGSDWRFNIEEIDIWRSNLEGKQ